MTAKRPAAGRQHDPPHLVAPPRLHRLEHGAVLAIDRQDAGPGRAGQSMTSGPAMTSVSLLAKATRLPASSAAQVLRSPALPTIAATTMSTSGTLATVRAASGPIEQFGTRGQARPVVLAAAAADRSPRPSAGCRPSGLLDRAVRAWPGPTRPLPAAGPSLGGNHLQRVAADAAGRSKHGDISRRHPLDAESSAMLVGRDCHSRRSRRPILTIVQEF